MRFPILTGVRWLIVIAGVICIFCGIFALAGSVSTFPNLFELLRNPGLALLGWGLGLGCIFSGLLLIGISETIGLVMTAEHSLFRMADALEASKEYQLERLINSPKPTTSIVDAGDALEKAFGSAAPYSELAKENPEDKYRPKS